MVDRQQTRQLAGLDDFQTQLQVEGDDGIAYIELQPTTESGQVTLDLAFQSEHGLERNVRRQQLRTWLEARAARLGAGRLRRGIARLLDARRATCSRSRTTSPRTTSSPTARSASTRRGACSASGCSRWPTSPIRARRARTARRLAQVIDPDEFYLIYGDGSEQRYDAPSQSKLYLKLERPQFYALFGDYDTGLTETELDPLQPHDERPQVGVRRRDAPVQRVRVRHRAALRARRDPGQRHLGPVPAVRHRTS